MIFTHPVKFGVERNCAVDIGAGLSVGVTYSVSDNSLLSVSASGILTVVRDVTSDTEAFVIATETSTGIRKAVIDIQVVPQAVDLSTLVDVSGSPTSFLETLSYPGNGGGGSGAFSGAGIALVFGGGTGASPSVNYSGVEKYSFATGARSTAGIALMGDLTAHPGGEARSQGAAASNTTNAFVFGGGDYNLYNGYSGGSFATAVENYVFSTLGTKGSSPLALSQANGRIAAASDKSANAFVFGGYAGGGYLDTVEWYLFNNLASKGTTSAVLQRGYQVPAACGNSVFAFMFPGFNNQGATLFACEQFPFATGVRTVLASTLSTAQFGMSSAGNETQAYVFGGSSPSFTPIATVDVFNFATPGTRGTAAAIALAADRYYSSAASNSTSAFIFGGSSTSNDTTAGVDTCESYQFASMATRGATPAALSSGRIATAAASDHQ
jgi:hypothetical protein